MRRFLIVPVIALLALARVDAAEESLSLEHVVVSHTGISEEYARAIGRTTAAARAAAVEKFGFDMPDVIVVNVTVDPAADVRLFNDGQDRFSLTIRSENDLRKPSTSGIFQLYGLCHEVGHLAMYRPIQDKRWMTSATGEGWALYLGRRLVDEVHAKEGPDLWPDRYDYLEDGMKRLEKRLAAGPTDPVSKGAGFWKELAEIVGDKGVAPIFAAWGKASHDPSDPGKTLGKVLAETAAAPEASDWWKRAEGVLVLERPKSDFAPKAADAGKAAGPPRELAHDDGKQASKGSIAGGGHAVRFEVPNDSCYLTSVRIHGSRYGHPQAPKEDFHVWLCDENFKAIADFPFPYSKFRRAAPEWVSLEVKRTNVPRKFIVCVGFNPTGTKGVFVSRDASATGNSLTGLPGGRGGRFQQGDWMIRATVVGPEEAGPARTAAKPATGAGSKTRKWTDATGSFSIEAELVESDDENVRLRRADGTMITVPIEKLSEADQEFVRSQSEGPGEAGPETVYVTQLTGKPRELMVDDGRPANKRSLPQGLAVAFDAPGPGCYMTSIRIHGGRYGYAQAPKEDFHVSLCDEDFSLITDFAFPYSKFQRGDPKWVTLRVKPTKVPLKFVICVDFNPTGTKGVFVSHDGEGKALVGLPGKRAGTFSGGDWLIRVAVDRLKN